MHEVGRLRGLKADDSDDVPGFRLLHHEPFNSNSKMATSTLRLDDGRSIAVMKGAPHVVLDRCSLSQQQRQRAEDAVDEMAAAGLRALGVAISEPYRGRKGLNELRWHCVGCVSLLDPPREDSAETIRQLKELGISVKVSGSLAQPAAEPTQ